MAPLYWPLMLLLAAVVLLIFEVFIPSGGVLGILSGLAFAISIGTAFAYGGLKLGTAFMAGTSILVPVLLYLAVQWWPKTPIGKRILIQPPDESQLISTARRERQQWLGQVGVALTALLPSGAIRIGSKTLDAISDGMTIEKGTPVEVIAVRGNHIVVRPSATPSRTSPASVISDRPLDRAVPDPFDDSLS